MVDTADVPYDRFKDTKIDVDKDSETREFAKPNPDSITSDEFQKLKDFQNKYNHANFIRKVYTVVFLQLLNVASFVLLFVGNSDVNSWIKTHQYFIIIFGATAILTYSFHFCCRHFQWIFLNFLGFVFYTMAEGLFVASLVTIFEANIILVSTGVTILLSLVLTIYSFKTSIDYTLYNLNLFIILIILLVVGVLAVLVWETFPALLFVAAIIGDALFALYFIHSTQKVSETYDVSSAVVIFVAHINLFIFITITVQLSYTLY